ncbi:helix-turn-helix domain-containing protein [Methylobacterium nodulans]|uniref:DNA binding domain protein, excisionase family n=1 Tax=Methylobacterium nodulans (strain LMG 21967 / CNCM I-2342 / ORS 2060) TaxID=460265 RepID=B8IWM5_METNO|nr:helix-turn-helix domain-containing protein [Methylobacterium nodulans]ACL62916.1 DNA binding domain protein, excisionase family [Methylobacterium nodulans ORS 2060]
MTMPAFAEPLGGRLPSDDEKAAANQLRKIIAAHAADDAKLRVIDEDKKPIDITLTPALSNLLMEVLRHVGSGDVVTLVPVGQMMSTQQAADILNVSRPFLISLLDRGDIRHTKVGRHRRIKAEDLFAYKKRRDEGHNEALSALTEMDAEYL